MVQILPPLRGARLLLAAPALAVALVACKVEHKPVDGGSQAAPADAVDGFAGKASDLQAQVTSVWDSRAMPLLQRRAVDYVELRNAIKGGLDAAGAKYGYRERGEGAPWNFVSRFAGSIIAADTASSAGTIDVDLDGDGKADLQVQVGPVVEGTSIRDNLDFISFSSYSNQIEFAQLANAFNARACDQALKPIARDRLVVGARVEGIGTFTTDDLSDVPVVTPVRFSLASAK
jgi:predicted lipoprotein